MTSAGRVFSPGDHVRGSWDCAVVTEVAHLVTVRWCGRGGITHRQPSTITLLDAPPCEIAPARVLSPDENDREADFRA